MLWKSLMMVAGSAVLLAGCGKSGGDGATDGAQMSRDEVAAQVDAVKLKPGQWESSFTLDDIEMRGLPAGVASGEMKKRMKAAMGQKAIRHCVTPEQAAKPSADMFSGQGDKDCTYQGFEMNGGAMKGVVSCRKEGGTMTAAMAGHYAPESYDMTMDMTSTQGKDGMGMTMKARTQGKWIGAQCAPDNKG